jgi:hypothetical protein
MGVAAQVRNASQIRITERFVRKRHVLAADDRIHELKQGMAVFA